VHADFDVASCSLVFSLANETQKRETVHGMVRRLLRKSIPAQVRLLQSFGEARQAKEFVENPPDALAALPADKLERIAKEAGSEASSMISAGIDNPKGLWADLAACDDQPPTCVCGCALHRVNGKDRGCRNVICDLCEDRIELTPHKMIWTCKNKADTVLHAKSYDLCERCFCYHTCGQ
jgi:hypothetical protein